MPSLQELLSRSITQNLGLADILAKRDQEAQMMGQTQMKLADLEANTIRQQAQNRAALGSGIGGALGSAAGFILSGGNPLAASAGARIGGAIGGGGNLMSTIPGIASDTFQSIAKQQFEGQKLGQKSITDLAEKGFVPASPSEAEFKLNIGGQEQGFKKLIKPPVDTLSQLAKESYSKQLGIPISQIPNTLSEAKPLIENIARQKTIEIQTEKQDKRDTAAVNNNLYKAIKDAVSSNEYKDSLEQYGAVKNLDKVISLEKNPLGNAAFPTMIRKVFGDSGNVAVAEQASTRLFGSVNNKFVQAIENVKSGELTEQNKKYLKQALEVFKAEAANRIKEVIDSHKQSFSDIYSGSIEQSKIDKAFSPYYKKDSNISNIGPSTIQSQKIIKLKDGRVVNAIYYPGGR